MSSKLKKWKEDSQNRRGLSQAANSECTRTFESQEITAVHILQHIGNVLHCILHIGQPHIFTNQPGAINWGPGGTVQNLHFCYFLHNELVTDPMRGSDLLVKRWNKPIVPNLWNDSYAAETLGRSVLWVLWGAINSWILQNPGTGQKSLQIRFFCPGNIVFSSFLLLHLFSCIYFDFSLHIFPSLLFFCFLPLQFSSPQVSAAVGTGFSTWKSSWLWMEAKISHFFPGLASYTCSCQPLKTDKPSSDSLSMKSRVFQITLRLVCQVLFCRDVLRGN